MGCNNGTFTYLSSVKNRAAHTYKTTLSESTGMYRSVMPDCHIILHNGRTSSVGYMNHRTILHIATVTHSDRSNITSYGSPEPYGALVAHCDITNNSSVLAEITVLSPLGRKSFV